MRHQASFLRDILSACRKIETIVAATDEDSFLKDEVLPAAVLHHPTVIGEAIGRLSVELRERHPEVPWRQIMAVRNRIVHAYFDLDWQILWDAANGEIPELHRQVLDILTTEFWNLNSIEVLESARRYGFTTIFPTPSRYPSAISNASPIWSIARVCVTSGANHSVRAAIIFSAACDS